MPTLADRREELLKEQNHQVDEKSHDYFLTSDWEIDLGVYLDTGKTPSHYSDLKFYARLLLYLKIMQEIMVRSYQKVEDKLVAAADTQFFFQKDLAEQGDEKTREK